MFACLFPSRVDAVVLGSTGPPKGQSLAQQVCLAWPSDHEVLEDIIAFHALLAPVLDLPPEQLITNGHLAIHSIPTAPCGQAEFKQEESQRSSSLQYCQETKVAHIVLQLEGQSHHIIQSIIDEYVSVLAGRVLVLADHSDGDAQLDVAHLHVLSVQACAFTLDTHRR